MSRAARGRGRETARALDREDVERLLDDADHVRSRAASVQMQQGSTSVDVLAERAEPDALLDLDDRLGERLRFLGRGAQQVIREALRALRADAGQPVELVDQPRDGRGGRWSRPGMDHGLVQPYFLLARRRRGSSGPRLRRRPGAPPRSTEAGHAAERSIR